MYGYEWTDQNGIYKLSVSSKIEKEIRPVFKEELDYFGFSAHWTYPNTKEPLLWAEGIRRYVLNGVCVAEAVGGGFYTKPTIKIFKDGLTLEPINIDALWKENERLMLGLEKTAWNLIDKTFEEYSKQGMAFVVSFSGGKDSLALLQLVSDKLSPDKFFVIFSNTGMELSCTIDTIEKAKLHWPGLRFEEASSHLKPTDSWDEFGPPGRRMRWCCAVHKSVPTLLLLRELTHNYDIKAVVFDGVRAEESARRAGYDEISVGAKNINQINCSPILKWNAAELFIYLLHKGILLNDAYRFGFNRVGCTICPLSSGWRDSISNHVYADEIAPLLHKVEEYTDDVGIRPSQRVKYIEQNGWRTRMGGRGLKNGGNRVSETIADDVIHFSFSEIKQNWLSVAPLLGPIVEYNNGEGSQIINHQEFRFCINPSSDGCSVSYSPYSVMDRYVISHLRGVANKVAYCIGCKACCVQCPTGAFNIDEFGHIFIRSEKCVHCCNCITYTNGKGCLVAKSISTTGGSNMDLKGMNRYQTFGLRRTFLEHFFQYKVDCFSMSQLGTRQYDSLKIWLREGGLLSAANKGEKSGAVTPLFEKLEPIGAGNPLTWAIIWTNLAYNSIIAKWYMLYVPAGEIYEKNELVFQLGDDYSKSTRDNAVTALLETFRHSPIGSVLKQGIPITSGNSFKFSKQGWNTPEAVAILYALYMWAEATGRYTFTLSQLNTARGNPYAKGVDPVSIFGINPDRFKDILQDISLQYDKYIRTTFVADLDNVKLFPEYTSLDIVDLIKK